MSISFLLYPLPTNLRQYSDTSSSEDSGSSGDGDENNNTSGIVEETASKFLRLVSRTLSRSASRNTAMSTPTAEDPEKQIGERKGYIQMCKPPKSVPSCRFILPCSVCFGLSEVSIAGTRWRLRELSLLAHAT